MTAAALSHDLMTETVFIACLAVGLFVANAHADDWHETPSVVEAAAPTNLVDTVVGELIPKEIPPTPSVSFSCGDSSPSQFNLLSLINADSLVAFERRIWRRDMARRDMQMRQHFPRDLLGPTALPLHRRSRRH